MPKRKDVQTLKNICMRCVSLNLIKYFTEELQCLPWYLRQDLIQFLHDLAGKNYNKINHFDINRLIGENVRKLTISFSGDSQALCNDTFCEVLRTSNNLTHFTCNFVGISTREDFHNFALNIPNIVFLCIDSCLFSRPDGCSPYLLNDDFLEAVGNNCFKLESLDLVAEITDEGIQRLCVSKSQGRNIKYLSLGTDGSKLTEAGCLIALFNLKQLKILDHCKVLPALVKLFHESNGSQPPKFEICELPKGDVDFVMSDIPSGFLPFLTKCCPNIRKLKLEFSSFKRRHTEDLRKCKEVVTFNLEIEVQNVPLPLSVLRDIGLQLTKLTLFKNKVDVVMVGYTCPNLKELCLLNVMYTPIVDMAPNLYTNSYKKLDTLVLMSSSSVPIPIPQVQFLIENCVALQTLRIIGNNELTDKVFVSILQTNPLSHLSYVFFNHCYKLSKVSIFQLLKMENELEKLIIMDCQKFSRENFSEIKNYIRQNNFEVFLHLETESFLPLY